MAASEIIMTTGTAPSTPGAGKAKFYIDSNNVPAVVDSAGTTKSVLGAGVAGSSTPADPTGTASTTGVMAGLAASFTPATTGRIYLVASGNLTNSTAAAGDGCKAQIRYGTGSAPANAAALTGTAVGNIVTAVLMRATASDLVPFSIQAVITGLTVGTTYWYDLSEAAIVGGTGQIKNICLAAIEV